MIIFKGKFKLNLHERSPIINPLLKILALTLLTSCNQQQVSSDYTDIFKALNKNTGDTIKFYGFRNIDTALFYAKRDQQNVLLVFGGYTLEKNWESLLNFNDPDFINAHFKAVWLPVDDKQLADDTNRVVTHNGQQWRLRTIGDYNHFFQIKTFGTSTQPFYCFIDSLQKPIGGTLSYEKDQTTIAEFIAGGMMR